MAQRGGVAVVTGLVAVGSLLILLSTRSIPNPIESGSRAPSFSLPRLEGQTGSGNVSLASLTGRVVLVNFWATWCKPCEDELPSMERLYRSLEGTGFELVAISVDTDTAAVEEFRQRYGLTFPILMDSDQVVARAYQTFRFPESFLVADDGRVLTRYVGPRSWDAPEYRARIEGLLGSPDATPDR